MKIRLPFCPMGERQIRAWRLQQFVPPILPVPARETMSVGPAEDWFCRCKMSSGGFYLRPARLDHCLVCGMNAPWTSDKPGLIHG